MQLRLDHCFSTPGGHRPYEAGYTDMTNPGSLATCVAQELNMIELGRNRG